MNLGFCLTGLVDLAPFNETKAEFDANSLI